MTKVDPFLALRVLSRLLRKVPRAVRSRLYDIASALFAVATLVVAFLPQAELLGLVVPDRWVAIFTLLSTFLPLLAKANLRPPEFAFGGESYLDPAERAQYKHDVHGPEGSCCH